MYIVLTCNCSKVFDCCLIKDYSLTYLLIMLCSLKNDIVISDAGAMNVKLDIRQAYKTHPAGYHLHNAFATKHKYTAIEYTVTYSCIGRCSRPYQSISFRSE